MADDKKTYVLDTNVLVHDSQCINKFEEHNIVIPLICIGELDGFKREVSERGQGARDAIREIEKLRLHAKQEGKTLKDGVSLGEGRGTIRVFSDNVKPVLGLAGKGKNEVDHLCVEITHYLSQNNENAILVTKDINLRIMADGKGIPCEDYRHDKKGYSLESLFQKGGVKELAVSTTLINDIYSSNPGVPYQLSEILSPDLFVNQGLMLRANDGSKQSVLVRYLPENKVRRLKYDKKKSIASIAARNMEQSFALDAAIDPAIRICAFLGKAGTGKTLLALAAGVHMTNNNEYRKMIVVRPTVVLGKDLGFLPGDLEEKESPFMDPIKDNLSIICDYGKDPDRQDEESYMDYIKQGQIELRTPIYLRGRSLPRVYIVVDETQNLTYHEVKTIITRVGEGTKIVFVGDPWQIDNPYLDEESNGLTSLVRRVMGKRDYVVTEFLKKGERDPSITDDLTDLLG